MNRNLLLFGLLGILVVVSYLVLQKPGEQSSSGETGKLLDVDSSAVDRIEIKSPTSIVLLEKKGAEWFLERPLTDKADPTAVANAIHQAKNLNITGIVSSNAEKHSVFQVDSAGTFVTIYERGTAITSFIIGKPSMSFTDTYVRKVNANDVNTVSGTFAYVFVRGLREWRNKTIVSVPLESINEVKFQYGDTTFVLALKDSLWMIGNTATDMAVVPNVLSALSAVAVDDFIDSSLSTVPKTTAVISYSGIQLRFVFSKPANKYFLQTSISPRWFVLEPWKATSILKRKKELVKAAS